jgi:hypothetical protein
MEQSPFEGLIFPQLVNNFLYFWNIISHRLAQKTGHWPTLSQKNLVYSATYYFFKILTFTFTSCL